MNIFNIIEKERKRNRELFYHNFNGFPSKCKLCKKIRLIRENTWVSIKEKCPIFNIINPHIDNVIDIILSSLYLLLETFDRICLTPNQIESSNNTEGIIKDE